MTEAPGRLSRTFRAILARSRLVLLAYALLLVAGTLGVISPSGNEVGPFLPVEQSAPTRARTGKVRQLQAAAHDGLRAPFFQRRIVQIGVGTRRQHFHRERRRFGKIAGDHFDFAGL